jgi:hypothetical protein
MLVDCNSPQEVHDYAQALEYALQDAFVFSEWVEIIGRTDCEVYKHELKACADLSIDRINTAFNT